MTLSLAPGLRILLVEDTEADVALTMRALGKVNLANAVDVARDGQEALDYLWAQGPFAARSGQPLPVVVMLDLNLPRVAGLDVLRALRADARTKLVPVVILTSSDEEQDRVRSYLQGANSFVRKPVVFQEFAESVAHLGVYWAAINRPPP